MDKIRLLHVFGQLGVGGAERQVLELCRRMDRDRFEVSMLSYAVIPDSIEHLFREIGIPVVVFDKLTMPVWRFFPKLRRVQARAGSASLSLYAQEHPVAVTK